MPRVIRYYDKIAESYIREVTLPDIPLEELQKHFGVSSDNPMYDSYLIGVKDKEFFRCYSNIKFFFDQFDYFLEYDSS
jgi:hypothetical protein